MAKVSFKSLREEALSGAKFEPFVLELPGKQKDIVIPAVPTGLFLSTLVMDGVMPMVGSAWKFLEAVCPDDDWDRLSRLLKGEPLPVLSALVDQITEHFNLIFENGEGPKDSDDSEE